MNPHEFDKILEKFVSFFRKYSEFEFALHFRGLKASVFVIYWTLFAEYKVMNRYWSVYLFNHVYKIYSKVAQAVFESDFFKYLT